MEPDATRPSARVGERLYWLVLERFPGEGDAMDITDRLAGKVALVTGGSRGIGAEIVRRLAAEGADVGFTYHTAKDEAEQVAAQVRELGRRVIAVAADLGDPVVPATVVD